MNMTALAHEVCRIEPSLAQRIRNVFYANDEAHRSYNIHRIAFVRLLEKDPVEAQQRSLSATKCQRKMAELQEQFEELMKEVETWERQ